MNVSVLECMHAYIVELTFNKSTIPFKFLSIESVMTFIFVCVWQDLDLPDAPRIKQLDEFLEGYK